MTSSEQTRKLFLLGTIGIGALIVVGLIWAMASGPGLGSGQSLSFNDDNDPSFGPGESSVVVRVFGDFQCPACRAAEAGFAYAKKTYGDKVRFIWNDFPLQSLHPNALAAANAARCAEAQGKFWEYHDKLYAEQPNWDTLSSPTDAFLSYAIGLNLKKDDFTACMTDKTYQNKIMDDLQEGNRLGINGTPTFFIGDARTVGVLENDIWDRELQKRLQGLSTASSTK